MGNSSFENLAPFRRLVPQCPIRGPQAQFKPLEDFTQSVSTPHFPDWIDGDYTEEVPIVED